MIKSQTIEEKEPEVTKTIIEELNSDITSDDKNQLRPSSLDEYIGQESLKKQLSIIIKSAQVRTTLPEHILFYGQPGLGKTTLAYLLASELNVDIKIVSAPSLQKIGDLVSLLVNIDKPTVLFIDEIHRLRKQIEESLYTAMEEGKVDLMIGKGQGVNTTRIDLEPFMVVGATTQFGSIAKPLRDRFPSIFKLESYRMEEIYDIVERNIDILGLNLAKDAKILVCKRCRGIPRVANNILKRLLDLQVVNKFDQIDEKTTLDFLIEMGVHEKGLTGNDISYLRSIQNGSVGLNTIAGMMLEETDTIEYVIEPYLISLGYVDKDSSGRRLTKKGQDFLVKLKS